MENKTENKKSRIFTWAMVVALVMFIMASCCGMLTSAGGDNSSIQFFPKKSEPDTPKYRLEDFKQEVSQLHSRHTQEVRELHAAFLREMDSSGNSSFQEAQNNIDSVMEHFTGFKNTAYLIYLRAYDMVSTDGGHLDQHIAQYLGPAIIQPCVAGNSAINETLNNFLHKLQEKDNAFNAEVAQKLNKFPAGSSDAAEGKKFIANLEKINRQITELVEKKLWLTLGIAIDAVLYKQLIAALIRVAGSTIAKLAGSTMIAIADGPLPIGDIIAVLGVAWCAWDIYQVQKELPGELRSTIEQAITQYQRQSRETALNTAQEALDMCLNSSENAVAMIVR